jgi:hypothetical protein
MLINVDKNLHLRKLEGRYTAIKLAAALKVLTIPQGMRKGP